MMLPVAILLMSLASWSEAVSPLSIELARTDAFQDRAADMMAMLKIVDVTDRNYKSWWATFTTLLQAYELKITDESLFCSSWDTLSADLTVLDEKVTLVQDGLESLEAQLEAIEKILEEAKIGGQTGLHCHEPDENPAAKPICDALDKLKADKDAQKLKLIDEHKQVAAHMDKGKNHKCECAYTEYTGAWGPCSQTCTPEDGDAGFQKEKREIKWQPRNGGAVCDPKELEQSQKCNDVCCPVDCVLKPWGKWTVCPNTCHIKTERQTRTRDIDVHPKCGGKACDSKLEDVRDCENPLDVKTAELETCQKNENELKIINIELAAKLCNPNPCHNGAACEEGHCTCEAGFMGHFCDKKV